MVFGKIRNRRKKREARHAREVEALDQKEKDVNYERERESIEAARQRRFAEEGATPEDRLAKDRDRQDADKVAARQYADELLNRDVQGLSPQRRQQMLDAGQFNLSRDLQNSQRKLVSGQGRMGMRGGIAYAQRADLARMGQEARAGIESDVNRLDADMAMKKLAAMIAMEQGERGLAASAYDRSRAEVTAEENRRQNQLALDMLLRRYGVG